MTTYKEFLKQQKLHAKRSKGRALKRARNNRPHRTNTTIALRRFKMKPIGSDDRRTEYRNGQRFMFVKGKLQGKFYEIIN